MVENLSKQLTKFYQYQGLNAEATSDTSVQIVFNAKRILFIIVNLSGRDTTISIQSKNDFSDYPRKLIMTVFSKGTLLYKSPSSFIRSINYIPESVEDIFSSFSSTLVLYSKKMYELNELLAEYKLNPVEVCRKKNISLLYTRRWNLPKGNEYIDITQNKYYELFKESSPANYQRCIALISSKGSQAIITVYKKHNDGSLIYFSNGEANCDWTSILAYLLDEMNSVFNKTLNLRSSSYSINPDDFSCSNN